MITNEQIEAAAFQIQCEFGVTITAARIAAQRALAAAQAGETDNQLDMLQKELDDMTGRCRLAEQRVWNLAFAAGIEAAAQELKRYPDLAARIRALRPPTETAERPVLFEPNCSRWPSCGCKQICRQRTIWQPAGPSDAVLYDPLGAVMSNEYPTKDSQ